MAAAANLINTGWTWVQRTAEDRLHQDIPTGPASPTHRVRPPSSMSKNRAAARDSDGLSGGRARGVRGALDRFRRWLLLNPQTEKKESEVSYLFRFLQMKTAFVPWTCSCMMQRTQMYVVEKLPRQKWRHSGALYGSANDERSTVCKQRGGRGDARR